MLPDVSGFSDEKLAAQLAALTDQGAEASPDTVAIAFVRAVEAEAARRGIAFDPFFNANPDVEG